MVEDTAKKIFDTLHQLYSTKLYPAAISVLRFLVNNRDAIWILIAVVTVLAVVRSKVKFVNSHRILPKVIDAVSGCLVILVLIVSFFRFGPTVSDYLDKYDSDSESSTTTTSQPQSTSQNQNTSKPSNQTTTPQTTKYLYYSISCSGCYAEGCNRNGYNYSGYSAEYYSYYRSVCQSCSCTSVYGRSFWK